MTKLLGQRWESKHGAVPTREWQRLLARFAHESAEQIASRIVSRLQPNGRGEIWPPEMADVIAMCQPKPEDFGLPTVNEAYRDAVHGRWSRHPVVYEAARRVGTFELRNHSEARSRPEFEREYAEVCVEWMAGRRFEGPKLNPEAQLPLQPKQRPTPEEVRARCEEMRRVIGKLPEPIAPDVPPVPLNDVDLTDSAARYQRKSA